MAPAVLPPAGLSGLEEHRRQGGARLGPALPGRWQARVESRESPQKSKDTLIPEFRQVWEAAGFKTSGTWEEVFGKSAVTDGIFMAWHISRYIGRVAEAGKAEYPLPMFCNAALYGVGRGSQPPPSGGRPWDLVMDVWKAGGGPQIDMLSPDIYSEADFRRQSALRLRTPRRHGLLAVRHRSAGPSG